jgi:hypothetical protein
MAECAFDSKRCRILWNDRDRDVDRNRIAITVNARRVAHGGFSHHSLDRQWTENQSLRRSL